MMRTGYQGTVSINQQLTTEPSAKQGDILKGLQELIQSGVSEITIPLVDKNQLVNDLNGRDSITVNAFATFEIAEVNQKVMATFKGYGPLPPSFTVTHVTLTEPFPPEVPVASIDKNWKRSYDQGILTLTLPDIRYTRNGDVYEAAPITFGITVKPTRTGTFLLHDAQLSYREDNLVNSQFFNNLTLQVANQIPPVTGLTVSPEKASIRVGEKIGLKVKITPENADRSVIWTSSDSTVAAVSASGIVTGVQPGIAVITVSTPDGRFSATSEITVTSKPELRLYADSGWEEPYPEKAVITVEVIDYVGAFPVKVEITVDGVQLSEAAVEQSPPTLLGDGRQKIAYTFEVEAARKQTGTGIGEVLRVNPALIAVEARNAFGISADPVSNTLLFNPVTAFVATLEREDVNGNSTGTVTAIPITPVLEDVRFFWLSDVPAHEVTASSPWVPFNQGRKATGVPLHPVESTTLVVGMFQDFNRDGDYVQDDGSPDENEIVVREVTLAPGIIPPDFTLQPGERLGDHVKVIVKPDLETIAETTRWYYKTGAEQEWTEFFLAQKGEQAAGEFVIAFDKGPEGLVNTLVTVKAVTPVDGVEDERATTVKTLLLLPKKGSDGDDGSVPEDLSPHVYIKVDNAHEILENRAVQVQLGYSFGGSEGLQLSQARYAIAEADNHVDLIGELMAGNGISMKDGLQNRVVRNLKTTTGRSQTYKVAIFVEIEMLHSLTREVLWTETYTKEAEVTVKAKNNLN